MPNPKQLVTGDCHVIACASDSTSNLATMPMANSSINCNCRIDNPNPESRVKTLSNKQIIAQPKICALIFPSDSVTALTLYAYSSAICLSSVIAGPLMSHWEYLVYLLFFVSVLCAVRCCLWAAGYYDTQWNWYSGCLLFEHLSSSPCPCHKSTVYTTHAHCHLWAEFYFLLRFLHAESVDTHEICENKIRCSAPKRKSIGANTRARATCVLMMWIHSFYSHHLHVERAVSIDRFAPATSNHISNRHST